MIAAQKAAGDHGQFGELGRSSNQVDLASYEGALAEMIGGEVTDTGGGCTAIQVNLRGGAELLVTDDNFAVPDGGDAMVGIYQQGTVDDPAFFVEIAGPQSVEDLAHSVRQVVSDWNQEHGYDQDQLRADLAASDPEHVLTAAEVEAVVTAADALDAQPQVRMSRLHGQPSVHLNADPENDNQAPGRIVAVNVSPDATDPRRSRVVYSSSWASSSVSMDTTLDAGEDVPGTLKRLADLQDRAEAQLASVTGAYMPQAFHANGHTFLRVDGPRGANVELLVAGERFGSGTVETDFGRIGIRDDELTKVVARIAFGTWLDQEANAPRTHQVTPPTARQFEQALLKP